MRAQALKAVRLADVVAGVSPAVERSLSWLDPAEPQQSLRRRLQRLGTQVAGTDLPGSPKTEYGYTVSGKNLTDSRLKYGSVLLCLELK